MTLYADVVAQHRAVAQLRAAARAPVHAYLFVGDAGAGARAAARSFAAALVCPDGGCGTCATCQRVLRGAHPDVRVFERTGASLRVEELRAALEEAFRSPVEAPRKVLVLTDLHLVDEQYPRLLKVLEEPPVTTVFVVLADHLPPGLATIASRCVRIDFPPVPSDEVRRALVAAGVAEAEAEVLAAASGGSVERARLLGDDPALADRQALWRSVPERLDGRGTTVAHLADELLGALDAAAEPVRARHAGEARQLAERARLTGEGATERKEVEARHRRDERRARSDELRFGLATLARVYRDRLVAARAGGGPAGALAAIQDATEAVARNPNEALLLQALLVRLSRLG